MNAQGGGFVLPAGVGIGQTRLRSDRPAKNARWYLARSPRPATPGLPAAPAILAKVGWGDLSFVDLEQLADHLASDEVFVVLPETPPGGQHLPGQKPTGEGTRGSWNWYDRPDDPPGPSVDDLADAAWYAVVDRSLVAVDRYGEADSAGTIRRQRGRRYMADGPTVSTGTVRLKAISPEQLRRELERILGGVAARAIDLPARTVREHRATNQRPPAEDPGGAPQ